MSDSARLALFTEARDRAGRALVDRLLQALPDLAESLELAAERADSVAGRHELFSVAALLRMEAAVRARRARTDLFDLTFRQLESNQRWRADRAAAADDPLADADLDVGARAVADELAAAVLARGGATAGRWCRRIDALLGTALPDARSPLGVHVFAAAAARSVAAPVADPQAAAVLRVGAVDRLAGPLADLFELLDEWLAERGVTPLATVSMGPASPARPQLEPPPDEAPADRAPAGERAAATDDDGRVRVPADGEGLPVAAGLPVSVAAVGAAGAGDGPVARIVQDTAVGRVLDPRAPPASQPTQALFRHAGALPKPSALEHDAVAFAHRQGVAPYGRDARLRWFEALRSQLRGTDAAPTQLAAVDLVAALFEYVIDDTRLPEAAKPLLWRLQQPAAALAALDSGYLADDRRSLRRLVENVAAICTAYPDETVKGSELHQRLETVVRAVEVVAHAFQARSTVLAEQVHREYERAAGGVAQLVGRVAKERHALEATPERRNRRDFRRRPSPEREQEVTRRIRQTIGERTAGMELPESVREFLLDVWLRHLRTAVLRDGEDSAAYRVAMQVVDDLLWSLDTRGPRQSRRQLATRIPPLIRLLTQGIRDIGARPEEFRAFLDELFLIHLRKMQREPRDGDGPQAEAPPTDPDHPPTASDNPPTACDNPPTASDKPPTALDASPAVAPASPPSRPAPASALDADVPGSDAAGDTASPPPADGPDAVAPPRGQSAPAGAGDEGGQERLLTLLGSVQLTDYPERAQRRRIDPDLAVARLQRGDWMELLARDGSPQDVKVAWINPRRTVVLLVRRPDRRALSLRMSDLRQRLADARASLLG